MAFASDSGLRLNVSPGLPEGGHAATRLAALQALFQAEADASLSELEQHLRAWTRSHLQTEQIQEVHTLAVKAHQDFAALVTIGIGGSDLSARVFHETFNHPYHNLLSVAERGGAPEVYFTGDTFDPIGLKALLYMLKSRGLLQKTLFNVISKSGKTGETLATLMIIRETLQQEVEDWRQQVVATTGLTEKSLLFQLHRETPFYGILPVPEGVGGRFSAFSPVGLFFLAMTAGIGETPAQRIEAAQAGIRHAAQCFTLPYTHPDNSAYRLAQWLDYAEEQHGTTSLVLYNYADNRCLGEWFVQLYTESIQERGIGANVIAAKGPTSNHSILNGIIAGPRDKVVVFIHWQALGPDLTIPRSTVGGLEAFEGLAMTHIQTASYQGTVEDFTDKGIPNATLTLPKRDISNMFALMRTLMDTVAVKGRLQDLHLFDGRAALDKELTYHQSAVEGYKRRTEEIARKMARTRHKSKTED